MLEQIRLRSSVGIERSLVIVRGVEIYRVRAEMDLFLVWWSIDFGFVLVVEIDLFLDVGCKSLSFSVSIEYYMVFVWLVVIDLGTAWRIYHI